jgi:hypothetical protein
MRHQIRTNVDAATFDAAKSPATSPALAHALLQRSSGRSGGSITVSPAVNMNGVALKPAVT